MSNPLPRPMMNRPAYRAPIESVVIMMILATYIRRQASQREDLRPMYVAIGPVHVISSVYIDEAMTDSTYQLKLTK